MTDLFADLLKQSGSGSSVSTPKNDSNLSLNERLSASKSSSPSKGSLDMDFLDSYVSSKPQKATSSLNKTVNASDLDFLLSGVSISKPEVVEKQKKQQPIVNSIDLLDDFFGQPIQKSSIENPSNSYNADEKLLDLKSEQSISKLKSSSLSSSHQELRDSALAELLDMGFPISNANKALDATSNGNDLDGAISYLMNQAHLQTNSRKNEYEHEHEHEREHGQSRSNDGDDFGKIINNLSTDFMSTASFLFDSGKKKLQKGVEIYRQQRLDNNNGQPLWMKNQHHYKANSIKLPDHENEEMDPEEMKRLIQQHLLREQILKQQKMAMNTDLLSETNEQLTTLSRISTDVKHYASRSSSKSASYDEVDISFSNRKPQIQSQKTTPKVSSATPVESLIETSSIIKPTFEIPVLNSAQEMEFNHFRKIAQESFKNGDYSRSLENYISATNIIPTDHPFQIMLCSNIALVYSKLGNPKDQLKYTDIGLELIKSKTNNLSINEMSMIFIERGKSVKNFWIKLMIKRAEALEFLEQWKLSKEAYEKLISLGENSKSIMDGKNRCNKMLNPAPMQTSSSSSSTSTLAAKSTTRSKSRPTIPTNNEKLQRVKESNNKKQREDEEKFNLHDQVELKLNNWRLGNKDNIRALICSLENILWPELNWKPVKLTDLVLDKNVKINYMKAVAKTHPDKISNDESTENKMIANGVFITLNEAWETFKTNKG
jgi:hypothetical protein